MQLAFRYDLLIATHLLEEHVPSSGSVKSLSCDILSLPTSIQHDPRKFVLHADGTHGSLLREGVAKARVSGGHVMISA